MEATMANPDHGADGRFIRTLEGAERDAEAARMRTERKSWREIAQALGYADPSGAKRAVDRVIKEAPAEAVEELRHQQAELLDLAERRLLEVLAKHKPTINMGKRYDDVDDDAQLIQAANALVRIEERRARLFNLDVPAKQEAASDSLIDAEVERFLARLGSGSETPAARHPES
jgi:hypothetical protein